METKIRVLIADPNEDFQLLMKSLLSQEGDMEAAGTSSDGSDALAKIEALRPDVVLLELVQRMFSGQFALAGQHSGEQDPVLLYAVETALQLHIAELTEPLRELYVTAYTLPSTSAYLYRSTAKRLEGIFGDYLPDAEAKDFYEMEIASAGMMRSFMAVPCDVYFTVERKIARFLECALKLYNVPVERRREVTAAVLQLDLHAMAAGIIRTTVQQAEKGFEAVKAEPAF